MWDNFIGKTVIDEYGVTFTDVQEHDGALYGRDVDGNLLQICADFVVVESEEAMERA